MIGYIIDNRLNYINVDGNGQAIYYVRDNEEDVGPNRTEGSRIKIIFKEGKVNDIKFYTGITGNLKPMFQLVDSEKRLEGFDWKDRIRPKSKFDIFKWDDDTLSASPRKEIQDVRQEKMPKQATEEHDGHSHEQEKHEH